VALKESAASASASRVSTASSGAGGGDASARVQAEKSSGGPDSKDANEGGDDGDD